MLDVGKNFEKIQCRFSERTENCPPHRIEMKIEERPCKWWKRFKQPVSYEQALSSIVENRNNW